MKKIVKNIFSVLAILLFFIACTNSDGSDNDNDNESTEPTAKSGTLTVLLRPVNDFQPEGGWEVKLIQSTTTKSEKIAGSNKLQTKFANVAFGDYSIETIALDESGKALFSTKKDFSMKKEFQVLTVDIENQTPSVDFSVVTKLPEEIKKVIVECPTSSASKTIDYKNNEKFSYSLAVAGTYTFNFSFQDNAGVEYFTATETVTVENGAKSISLTPIQTKVTPLIFSLPAGSTVAPGDTLTITCNSSGSQIYYTTDKTSPNNKSSLYVNPITIDNDMTVSAIAYLTIDGNSISSDMKIADYIVDADLLKSPVISGVAEGAVYNSDVNVEIKNPNAEGEIYYTVDGSTPTTSSTKYTSAIPLSDAKSYTLKAFVKSGTKASAVFTVNFKIEAVTVNAPVFSPDSEKTFNNAASITITSSSVGALIYYTTDASEPTESSTLYSGAISLTTNGSHTIKAVAVKDGVKSDVVTATYTLNLPKDIVETPVITPASGTFTTAQSVKIACGTSGADIYYTTDGTEPTDSSTKYTGGVSVSKTTTIKAIAVKSGCEDSSVATVTITINVQPAFDGIQIYVEKSLGYNQIHYWECSNSKYTATSWPGVAMDDTDKDYYTYEFENADSVNLLITKGDAKLCQDDIKITEKGSYKITSNGAEPFSPVPPVPQPPTVTVPTSARVGGSFTITVKSSTDLTSSNITIGGKSKTLTVGNNIFNVADFTTEAKTLSVSGSVANAAGSTPVTGNIVVSEKPVSTIVSDPKELRIYQVMVSSFQDGDPSRGFTCAYGPSNALKGGDLQGIINAADYIKDLGCNAIWMTPIFESNGGGELDSTGYFAYDYFNVDDQFGTNEKFAELVEVYHDKGMAVILDGVFGHNKGNVAASPNRTGIKNPGITPDTANPVNYATNGNSLKYYSDVASYWITEYDIDGWRFDQCYQLGGGEYNSGKNCNTGGMNYWYDIRKVVEAAAASNGTKGQDWGTLGYMVGEDWDGNQTSLQASVVSPRGSKGYGLNSCFDFPAYYQIIQGFAQEWDGKTTGNITTGLSYLYKTYQEKGYVCKEDDGSYDEYYPNFMLTNHDLYRIGDLIQKKYGCGFDNAQYVGRNKVLLAAQCAYSGPITIYYGDEIGARSADNSNGGGWYADNVARSSGKISGFNNWEKEVHDFTQKCLQARAEHEALWNGTNTQIVGEQTFYVAKKQGGGETIFIAFNYGTDSKSFDIGGSGTDLISGESFSGNVSVPGLSARYVLVK